MIGILGRARKFEVINLLLDEMQRDGCEPNVVTCNHLIHCYGHANLHNKCVGYILRNAKGKVQT
jgi:pentatricopeptide repeat protein